ncbi:tyrosine-type recombinase/integrase [Kribbella sp. NPDC050470]|uniref:tyrosine-type recombinase/integrase n=1 Tax=unclassified Kribbella TaxID=2644121 RepID=UPI00378B169B
MRQTAGHRWQHHNLRHGFVSLLSESGLSIEQISLLVGHKSTQVTETVYRHQLRPVLRRWTGCCLRTDSHSVRHSGHERGRSPERETGL